MRKELILVAALLLAVAFGVSQPQPTQAVRPDILCPLCPPGWVSTGPPLCRCIRGGAIATDATLAGNDASALPGGPTSISVLENTFGGTFQPVSEQMQIGSVLSQSGNGARGIVFGESMTGDVGHVFNVLNNNGTIHFLDGQIGGSGLNNFNNFQNFQFLLTHPGTP